MPNLFCVFSFKDAYHRLKRINPDEYNGASLLGLTAVVVKSHGSANVDAFARAIADAALQARLQIPQKNLGRFTTLLINKF